MNNPYVSFVTDMRKIQMTCPIWGAGGVGDDGSC